MAFLGIRGLVTRRQPRLPIGPLHARLRRNAAATGVPVDVQLGGRRSAERRAYRRGLTAGWLTETAADRLAIYVLGVHPSDVWDEWWEAA